MFADRLYPTRFFPTRYFPGAGAAATPSVGGGLAQMFPELERLIGEERITEEELSLILAGLAEAGP